MRMKDKNLLPFLLASGMANEGIGDVERLTDEEKAERHKRKEQKAKQKQREKQGVKEFWYEDNVIYARNQKNADRKARNKGYIK